MIMLQMTTLIYIKCKSFFIYHYPLTKIDFEYNKINFKIQIKIIYLGSNLTFWLFAGKELFHSPK